MTRSSWFGAAALVAAIGMTAPTLAVAQTQTAPAQATAAATFTDAQVTAFAAASTEIDPISQRLASATPEQRTEAATQIRAILQRHSLDANTYNAIATQAQTDTALQARVTAARASTAAPAAAETPPAPN
ncbi:MAG TPA: DUF4168 domain-containing protein [Verrucomicrobiae bacterium]|jgi:hypothetical protein|nr:DUF4168 domain-containing protein [Verrucomicrobiae bacterium]